MEKANSKGRRIKFKSVLNDCVLSVPSRVARDYANILEKNENIRRYEVSRPLDPDLIGLINKINIRKEYFLMDWTSDFVIYDEKNQIIVREMVYEKDLMKKAIIEKLELSRRYWEQQNVSNWKIVVISEDN